MFWQDILNACRGLMSSSVNIKIYIWQLRDVRKQLVRPMRKLIIWSRLDMWPRLYCQKSLVVFIALRSLPWRKQKTLILAIITVTVDQLLSHPTINIDKKWFMSETSQALNLVACLITAPNSLQLATTTLTDVELTAYQIRTQIF